MSSLTCIPVLSSSSSPRRFSTPQITKSQIHTVQRLLIPVYQNNSSFGSSEISRHGNMGLHRTQCRPKSVEQGVDFDPNSEISDEKVTVSSNDQSPSGSFLSLLCPLLKLLGGGDPSQPRNDYVEVATSSLATLARFPWGSRSLLNDSRHQVTMDKPHSYLQLFEFEACPFCRRVREAMTELDLSVEIYPCPKGSLRHREMVRKIGGKEQFPFLVNPNAGISIYESGEIVKYLFQQYGQGMSPSIGLLESTLFTGWVPTILRVGRGLALWEKASADLPSKKLELFSYENNPYARIVREALCELELPYILQNVGQGSSKSELLFQISGSKEVPYLIDPNSGVQLGNYKKILSYLFETYSTVS